MKKTYLIPLFALSLAALPLGGCDEKKDAAETPAASEAEAESSASPTTVTTEEALSTETAEPQASAITVTDARAFATAPSATTGAIFATLVNGGSDADFLLSAKSDVDATVEIHQTYEDPQTGATLMRKTAGVDVPANGQTRLEPTGFHIMLLGLTQPLVEGETFNVTLHFREAGDVVVPVTIVAPGAVSESHEHEGHDMAPEATGSDASAEATPSEAVPADVHTHE